MTKPWKPTKEQLLAATEKTVRDVIAPNLRVLFCGINPGLYTAAVGHHFARPGNRFWPALYAGGFTDRVLSPFDEDELLKSGYGITNVVSRTTAKGTKSKHTVKRHLSVDGSRAKIGRRDRDRTGDLFVGVQSELRHGASIT